LRRLNHRRARAQADHRRLEDQEIGGTEDQEVRRSGGQKIRRSEDQEVRRSGGQKIKRLKIIIKDRRRATSHAVTAATTGLPIS
jgi:hypothetical protein